MDAKWQLHRPSRAAPRRGNFSVRNREFPSAAEGVRETKRSEVQMPIGSDSDFLWLERIDHRGLVRAREKLEREHISKRSCPKDGKPPRTEECGRRGDLPVCDRQLFERPLNSSYSRVRAAVLPLSPPFLEAYVSPIRNRTTGNTPAGVSWGVRRAIHWPDKDRAPLSLRELVRR